MSTCLAIPLGLLDYQAAYDLQRRLHALVVANELPDLLLLLEHPHVYTLGRRGQQSHILASDEALTQLGVETHFTDRGGETTYHGPGQLVGYPIVNLRRWGGGVRKYVADPGTDANSRPCRRVWLWHRRLQRRQAHRRLGRRCEDCGHRRAREPQRHDARLRAQCLPRPLVLRPHRTLRYARRARHLYGART